MNTKLGQSILNKYVEQLKGGAGGKSVATVHSVRFDPPVQKEYEELGFHRGEIPLADGSDGYFFYRLSRPGEMPIGQVVQIVPEDEIWTASAAAVAEEERHILDALIETLDSPKHGDLVENVSVSGYRTTGVYVIKNTATPGQKPVLEICALDTEYDEYGHIGKGFSIGPKFPSGYWMDAKFDRASWNSDELEPVGVEIWSKIKPADLVRGSVSYLPDVAFWDYVRPWGVLRFRSESPKKLCTTLKEYKKHHKAHLIKHGGLNLYMDEGEIVYPTYE